MFVNFEVENSVLRVGFNPDKPANNDQLVKDAVASVLAIKDQLHGCVLKINGAASLPVGMAIAGEIAHVVKCVSCYNPKLQKYVVSITHDPNYTLGQLID